MKSAPDTTALELLTIAFVVLKLIGQIDWSWWWVLSPLAVGLVLVLLHGDHS